MCKIDLLPKTLKMADNIFYVEADIFLKCKNVEANASYSFIPILSDEKHRVELPIVLVVGKNRFGFFDRFIPKINQNLFQDYKIYKILEAVNGSLVCHTYKVYLKYEKWMLNAKLSLIQMN